MTTDPSTTDPSTTDPSSTAPPTRARRPTTTTLLGLGLVGLVVLAGVVGPWVISGDPLAQIAGQYLRPPSTAHLLGTDELDRDVLARTLAGVRTTLLIAIVAVPIGAIVGITLGLLSTTSRWTDLLVARVFDVVLAFPAVILAIAVAAVRGPGPVTVIAAVAITEIPLFGRLARTAAMRVLAQPYVESARLAGASPTRILRDHVVPNSAEPLLVQAALSLSLAVFVESALSFLGVGVRPPQPSLGSMLAGGVYSWDANPAYPLGPAVVIVALSLGFLLIARGIGGTRRG